MRPLRVQDLWAGCRVEWLGDAEAHPSAEVAARFSSLDTRDPSPTRRRFVDLRATAGLSEAVSPLRVFGVFAWREGTQAATTRRLP